MSNPIIITILLSIHRLMFIFHYSVYLNLLLLFFKLCSQCVFFSIFTLIYILHINWTVSLDVNHKKVLLIFNVLYVFVCIYLYVCLYLYFFLNCVYVFVCCHNVYMYLLIQLHDCINKLGIWWPISPMVCTDFLSNYIFFAISNIIRL